MKYCLADLFLTAVEYGGIAETFQEAKVVAMALS
jgi:hypothetical protein